MEDGSQAGGQRRTVEVGPTTFGCFWWFTSFFGCFGAFGCFSLFSTMVSIGRW